MTIYLLNQGTNAFGVRSGLAGVATSLDRAIEMLKEWYEDEKRSKGKAEELECELKLDGKYSYAMISGKESNAWIMLEIEEAWTNDWLNL